MPVESTTASDGRSSLSINDSNVIKQLLQQGYALLFKSAADDSNDTLDAGLSRVTPLYLGAHRTVSVVLKWTPKQAGDMTKPAVAAKLHARSVDRDGQKQAPGLTLRGQVVGPQDVPLSEVAVRARLVVPATGQVLSFPVADGQPALSTATNGRFEIQQRGGDQLPFQPYSQFAMGFAVRPSRDGGTASELVAPEPSHISPSEQPQVKLRLDQTGPAKPTLCVPCVHRNGKACRPAEGSLQALGQLLDSAGKKPLS